MCIVRVELCMYRERSVRTVDVNYLSDVRATTDMMLQYIVCHGW